MLLRIKNKIIKFILLVPILFNLSGCVYLVVGGIGALGGYIVSPDTVEGVTETGSLEVWDAAVDVISIVGVITDKEKESGIIKAKVGRTNVTVNIMPITSSASKVSVKARKTFLPKISLAQEIYVKIMSKVAE